MVAGRELEAVARVRIALSGFGDGSLARIAKHFEPGSVEWAVIHNADESINLALAAVGALPPTQNVSVLTNLEELDV